MANTSVQRVSVVPSHVRDQETGERYNAQVVVVTDIDMPFLGMVGFTIKFALAAIPAVLILMVVGTFAFGALGALLHR